MEVDGLERYVESRINRTWFWIGKGSVVVKDDTINDFPKTLGKRHNSLIWTHGPWMVSIPYPHSPTLTFIPSSYTSPSQDVGSTYILSVPHISCVCPWEGPLHLLFPLPVMILPSYLFIIHSSTTTSPGTFPLTSLIRYNLILCPSLCRIYPSATLTFCGFSVNV